MSLIDEVKNQIMLLSDKPKHEKMILFASIFTELLEAHNIKPVIVGGLSVEIYTRSDYTTRDIDFVFSGRDIANEILLELGFKKLGKDWFHEELELAIEIPDNVIDGDIDKVLTINLSNNKHIYVIGIEDIISDRLRACVFWKSSSDCEWGQRVLLIHQGQIDFNYLKDKASKDNTIDELNKWLGLLDHDLLT